MAEPPPPPFPEQFFKLLKVRQKPLQKRILEYLSQGGTPSINAISTDLDVWRSSVQRSLKTMKREGSVKDQWVMLAPEVVSGIKAHTFQITDMGRKELRFLQSLGDPPKTYPLGYCILMCLKDACPATAGQLAKMLSKNRDEVKRTMKSLRNKGLVECLYSQRRTSLGDNLITHLYRITELGRQVLNAGSHSYYEAMRRAKRPFAPLTHRSNRMPCSQVGDE